MEPIDIASRLDADHRAVLDMLPADLLDLSDMLRARAGIEAMTASMPAPELPDDVDIAEAVVSGLGDGPDVRVKLYRPRTTPATGGAALLWIHGGGMVLGSADADDLRCATLALATESLVVSVDYRLAPEHPVPAPIDDCHAALSWLASSADDLGVAPDRIAIGGASAGGGLAAGTALRARDEGGPALCFQFLVYPMLDDRNTTASSHMITDARVWNRNANIAAWNAYLSGTAGSEDVSPHAAPARASDLSGLPPAYIPVGTLDMFLDEDVAYAQALNHAGVDAELHVYPGAFHGSNSFVGESALSQRWAADDVAALRRGLGVTD